MSTNSGNAAPPPAKPIPVKRPPTPGKVAVGKGPSAQPGGAGGKRRVSGTHIASGEHHWQWPWWAALLLLAIGIAVFCWRVIPLF